MTSILLVAHTVLATASVTVSVLGVQAKTSARSRLVAGWLFAAVAAQTVVGALLYPVYLRRTKPVLRQLVAGARSVADVFDVKEHLAFVALTLTIGVFVLTRAEPKPSPLVRVLFGSAHAAIVVVAVLGLVVASLRAP